MRYTFNKDYIFKDYINDLYNIRLNYPKSDPMNLTAKLLLNSLYGRFGMHNNFNTLEFVNQGRFEKLTNNSNIKIENITQLGSKFLVSYNNENKINLDILSILLTEDFKLTFNQNKWFRNLMDANIQILEQIYTLKVTNLKRNLVYKNNKLVGTKPLKIEL